MLTREECLALLATAEIGRIAVSARALPLILPVRFAMDGDRIVIATHDGTTLDAATRDTVVAFETDGPSGHSTVGWSVHVNGIARHVTDPVDARPSRGAAAALVVAEQPAAVRRDLDRSMSPAARRSTPSHRSTVTTARSDTGREPPERRRGPSTLVAAAATRSR